MWNDLAQPATASHKSEVGAASACPLMAATCGERWRRKMQWWPLQLCSSSRCNQHELGQASAALSTADPLALPTATAHLPAHSRERSAPQAIGGVGVANFPMCLSGPQDTFFILCEADEMDDEAIRFSSRETYS